MKPPRAILLASILPIASLLPCSAGPVTLTSFDYPGQMNTVFRGINNNGQITGQYGGASASVGFVVDTPGQAGTTFVYPGSWVTYPGGIDDTGNVIGRQISFGGPSGAFLRASDGTFIPLLSDMSGTAISSSGQIALSGANVVYIKTGSGYTSFIVPGAGVASNAVNVTGVDRNLNIAGFYYSGHSTTESFYRSGDGTYQSIYIPGSLFTEAYGMNNLGQVVGFYSDGTSDHGFLWNLNGSYLTFDYPSSNYTFAAGINDHGEVVGFYYDGIGQTHGFVASTVPEPSTWVYFVFALPVALTKRSVRSALRSRLSAFALWA